MEKNFFCSENVQDCTVSRFTRSQSILDIPQSAWTKTHSFCPMRLYRVFLFLFWYQRA